MKYGRQERGNYEGGGEGGVSKQDLASSEDLTIKLPEGRDNC